MSSILPQGYIKWNGITYVFDASGIITGPPGQPGIMGEPGITGPIGNIGPIGPIGSQGIQGPTGVRGITGARGPTGTIGPIGTTGFIGVVGSTGPIGPTGTAGAIAPLNSVDSTLTIVSPILTRAPITGHISVPSGSTTSIVAPHPTTSTLSNVKAGVPYILHRSLTMAGNAGEGGTIITNNIPGFTNGFPFNALLVDAWIYCSQQLFGSSVQIFGTSGALTGSMSTGSVGLKRNTDTQTRLISSGHNINAIKTNGLFLTVRFEVILVFIPFG